MSETFELEDFLEESLSDKVDASAITNAIYSQWRAPRFGSTNPERMTNPLWDWMIRTKTAAFHATQRFKGPHSETSGPAWCFDRFGMTETVLPDGRRVFIGGEHEDHYDPDFYIYNDVIIWNPDDTIEVLGYPLEVFPPTDFHSATLVDNHIVIIGCLGYPSQRTAQSTQVAILNLDNGSMRLAKTHGPMPRWLYNHQSTWDEASRSIRLTRGMVLPPEGLAHEQENLDHWEFHVDTSGWTHTWSCPWHCWEVSRLDGKNLNLWVSSELLSPHGIFDSDSPDTDAPSWHDEIRRDLTRRGITLQQIQLIFRPDRRHDVEREQEWPLNCHSWNERRITVDGVTVRYVDERYFIRIVADGDLLEDVVRELAEDLRAKLEIVQGVPCHAIHTHPRANLREA